MGSKADWDAENRRALQVIRWTLCAVLQRWVATEASPPSLYGHNVDAVARKGFYLGQLAELARIQAKIDALKVRVSAGYLATPAPVSLAPSAAGRAATSGREGEPVLGVRCIGDPGSLPAAAVDVQQFPAVQ